MLNTILTFPKCVWCDRAKALLNEAGIEYAEQNIWTDPHARELFKVHGFKAVPQIFLDGKHIGGHDDLVVHLGRGTLI